MGVGCIQAAKKVLVIASGADKADALYSAICGTINPQCQASILQLHNDVTFVADEAAMSKLLADEKAMARLEATGVIVCR